MPNQLNCQTLFVAKTFNAVFDEKRLTLKLDQWLTDLEVDLVSLRVVIRAEYLGSAIGLCFARAKLSVFEKR